MTDIRLPICEGCTNSFMVDVDCQKSPEKCMYAKKCRREAVCPRECASLETCRRAYDEGRKRAAGENDLNTLAKVRERIYAIHANGWGEGSFKSQVLTVIVEMIDACPVPFDETDKAGQDGDGD